MGANRITLHFDGSYPGSLHDFRDRIGTDQPRAGPKWSFQTVNVSTCGKIFLNDMCSWQKCS